jgi:hypothetical protein
MLHTLKAKLYLKFRAPEGKRSPNCSALFDHKSRVRPFRCVRATASSPDC